MIADSNLFIYVTQPDYGYLIDWFKQNTPLARNVKDFEWITALKVVNPIREIF